MTAGTSASAGNQQIPRVWTLEQSVAVLGPMINRLVFVSHQVTGLLVTDRASLKSKSTFSVDALVTAVSYSSRDRLTADLARLGLQPDSALHTPSGRWKTADGATVELVPTDDTPRDAQHRWYEYALECTLAIPMGTHAVRVAGAPAFLALRLAAFARREPAACEPNADLEDALAVLAGRPEVEQELAAAPREVRGFIGSQLSELAGRPDADSVLELHIPDAARFPALAVESLERLRRLSAL